MRATVEVSSHPFLRYAGQAKTIRRRRKVSSLCPRVSHPVVAILNGKPLLRVAWGRRLSDGDKLHFYIIPQGGGGGSNPLSTILMLAAAVFIPPMAGYLGASMGISTATIGGIEGFTAMGVFKSAVTVVGLSLLSSVIQPPRSPTQVANSIAAPSPTYSASAQGNMARIDGAIPVQYGRMKFSPDLAAVPYYEFSGNDQYVYMLMCLGVGAFDVESINVQDTPISSFPDITTEISGPGELVKLFPSNVITSVEVSGQEAVSNIITSSEVNGQTAVTNIAIGPFVSCGPDTTINSITIIVGMPEGLYVPSDYAPLTTSITFKIEIRPIDSNGDPIGSWSSMPTETITGATYSPQTRSFQYLVLSERYLIRMTRTDAWDPEFQGRKLTWNSLGAGTDISLGPFTANPSGTSANKISIDVVMPRGLYYAEDDGGLSQMSVTWKISARQIDANGDPIEEDFEDLGIETYSAATTTPQRASYQYSVTPGRYQVRLARIDSKQTDARYGHEIVWAGLRAYLPETRNFGFVTMMAVRMRVTGSISGMASRMITVVATRKIKAWSPSTGWSSQTPSRSIAWAFADAARSVDYGPGLPESRIDLQALYELDQIWSSRGDHFDGRFDNQSTVWDVLSRIATTGRAKPYMQGGMLRIFRDAAQSVPSAVFTERNMVKGTFSIRYAMPTDQSANYCDVGYWDGTIWAPRRVGAVPSGVTASRAAKIETFGVTDRAHACRDGAYFAATSLYRRQFIEFQTEMAGFIPAMGDLVAIQHSMPSWGQHGEVVEWDAVNRTATLSDPMEWAEGEDHLIGFRKADGGFDGPYAATQVDEYKVKVDPAPSIVPSAGINESRTHIIFGSEEKWLRLARVINIKPRSTHRVTLELVNEDDRVHTADVGITVPPPSSSSLPTTVLAPVVTGLITRISENKMLVSWNPATGSTYYVIEQSDGGGSWLHVGQTESLSFVFEMLYGALTTVRVAAFGSTFGPWASDSLWSGDDALMWTGDDYPMWSS